MPSADRRILLIPSWYPSPHSPVNGIFIEDQARVLSERFNVLVFAQRTYGLRQLLRGRIPAGGGFASRAGVRLYEQGVFLPPRLPLRVAMAYQFKRATAAMAEIKRGWGMPDIIHSHVVLPGGWIGARLGRALNVPVVLTEHTGPFSSHLTSARHRVFVTETLRASTKVLAVSEVLADQIGQVDPSLPVEIVGNVILTSFFQPATVSTFQRSEGAPLSLFSVSLLNQGKGYEHLLRAARMLLDNGFRKFALRIGGDGPDRPRLEALICELGLQGICRVLGMLTREQVRDEMHRCDVFVLPSLAETFGVVVGEAMACGKPVLATRCGGPNFQVTPETGILVEPGDAGALADGIRKLSAEYSTYKPAAIRALVVRRFGEAAFLESISRSYQDATRTAALSPSTLQTRLTP